MNKPPAFQFYAKDWRSSPTRRRMDFRDKAIFLELMALAWDSDQPGIISLPFEEICSEIGVRAKVLLRFCSDYPTILLRNSEGLVLTRLLSQYKEHQSFIDSKRVAGQKGNAVRWHSESQTVALHLQSASAPASAKQNQHQQQRFALPEWVPSELWKAYEEMRTKIRKPMTSQARELSINKLWTLKGQGHEPKAVLEQSIMNSWQGLFPLKDSGAQPDFMEENLRVIRSVFGKSAS